MTTEDLLRLRALGEVSKVQFKERILDKYDISTIYLLPYTGAGTGIQRALEDGLQVEFKNDERIHEFLITIERKEDLDTVQANSDTDLDTVQANSDTDLDTVQANSDTDLDTVQANSDTDLDTVRANSDTDLDTIPQRRKLTNKEKDIIQFCSVPRSAKEILDRVGVSLHTKNREKYVTSLVEAGYLEMTNPDNPNASNQKYRKK